MKRTSLGSSDVRIPARSPGLSSTGPELTLKPTPSSFAMMFERVVFAQPGPARGAARGQATPPACGQRSRTPSGSPTILSWPLKSSKVSGRKLFSNSRSSSCKWRWLCMSNLSSMIKGKNSYLSRVLEIAATFLFNPANLALFTAEWRNSSR